MTNIERENGIKMIRIGEDLKFLGFALITLLSATLLAPNRASADINAGDATALAGAVLANPAILQGAVFESVPPSGTPNAIADESSTLGAFPTSGTSYAILSTGDAQLADQSNSSSSSGADVGGPNVRGNTDYDVSILRIDLSLLPTTNCLTLDFQFLSDEYPEWVGTSYNDGFIAELNRSTWRTDGTTIIAPDNFAFDSSGQVVSINSTGATEMRPENAEGTTYDGATALLQASVPYVVGDNNGSLPGNNSLYLSIFDQGDHVLDSAAFIDNVRTGLSGPEGTCAAGARADSPFVGLGDSIAAGHGLGPNGNTSSYPMMVLSRWGKPRGLDGVNIAKSGATSSDVLIKQIPQVVAGSPKIATLSVGANDIHFSECARSFFMGDESNPCLGPTLTTRLDTLRDNLQMIFASLPAAQFYVTHYYNPFPAPPGANEQACVAYRALAAKEMYESAGGSGTILGWDYVENMARTKQSSAYSFGSWIVNKLNATIASAATGESRVTIVPADFSGHDFCKPHDTARVYGPAVEVMGRGLDVDKALPSSCPYTADDPDPLWTWSGGGVSTRVLVNCAPHPTWEGQKALADAVIQALQTSPPI